MQLQLKFSVTFINEDVTYGGQLETVQVYAFDFIEAYEIAEKLRKELPDKKIKSIEEE